MLVSSRRSLLAVGILLSRLLLLHSPWLLHLGLLTLHRLAIALHWLAVALHGLALHRLTLHRLAITLHGLAIALHWLTVALHGLALHWLALHWLAISLHLELRRLTVGVWSHRLGHLLSLRHGPVAAISHRLLLLLLLDWISGRRGLRLGLPSRWLLLGWCSSRCLDLLHQIVLLKIAAELVIVDALLKTNQHVVELQVELIALL